MHNYAGNNQNFPVSVALMDDGIDVPSFANFAPSLQGNRDANAYLFARVISLPARNWRAGFTVAAGFAAVDLHWSTNAQLWNHLYYDSTGQTLYLAQLDGSSVNIVGSATTLATTANVLGSTVTTDGTTYVVFGPVRAGAPCALYQVPMGGAFALVSPTIDPNGTSAAMSHLAALWAAVTWSNSPNHLAYFVGNAAGVSFTTMLGIAPAAGGYLMASDGVAKTLVVGKAAGDKLYVGTSTTFSAGLALTTFLAAADVPISVTWAPWLQLTISGATTQGAWVMAVAVAGGTPTAIWASPDGNAWQLQKTLASIRFAPLAALAATEIKAMGPLIVLRGYDAAAGASWLAYSTDALSWYTGGFPLPGTASLGLRAAETQLASCEIGATSGQLQFSESLGLPAQVLS